MSGQQAFFTSDTALVREPRERSAHTARASEVGNATTNMTGQTITGKTLAERLIAAWLAPWSHGFTPLW
jgi:hypothetical protein